MKNFYYSNSFGENTVEIDDYEGKLEDPKTIELLLDKNIRDAIINFEEDTFRKTPSRDFLSYLWRSNIDKLKEFYFNKETYPVLAENGKLGKIILDLATSKLLEMFDDEELLEYVSIANKNDIIFSICDRIKEAKTEEEKITNKNTLLKYYKYLIKNISKKINVISKIFCAIPKDYHQEFLDLAIEPLKTYAANNENGNYDNIFYKYLLYRTYNPKEDIHFDTVSNTADKFKGINTLYYSKNLMYGLIERGEYVTDDKIIKFDEEALKWLHEYLFTKEGKKELLKNMDKNIFKNLYSYFSEEAIEYFLDDEGLKILDESNTFLNLLGNKIPLEKITNSQLFASLLAKHSPDNYSFDEYISYITNKYKKSTPAFNLLDNYLELNMYNYFYRVFSYLSAKFQLKYLSKNFTRLYELNNDEVFKGVKKRTYEQYKDKVNAKKWQYFDDDLLRMIENRNSYSAEQLETIFSNRDNILTIVKSSLLDDIYVEIINSKNEKLFELYTGDEFINVLIRNNRLDKIYKGIEGFKVDISPLMLNTTALTSIGEKAIEFYKMYYFGKYEKYLSDTSIYRSYWNFLHATHKLNNKETLFKILDFYLTSEKYLFAFADILEYKGRLVKEYFASRKDLITKVIKENKSEDINLIFVRLEDGEYAKEFTKDRENIALYNSWRDFLKLFKCEYDTNICSLIGGCTLSKEIMLNDRFAEKFVGRIKYDFSEEKIPYDYEYNPDNGTLTSAYANSSEIAANNYYAGTSIQKKKDKFLSINEELQIDLALICENKSILRELYHKIDSLTKMKENIMKSFNETEKDFKGYLKVLVNSSVDIYSIEFLRDMIDVILFNQRIKEVYDKYINQDLAKIKEDILNNVISNSKKDIISSLTNPFKDNEPVLEEYTLDDKKVVVPTVVYNGKPFNFLARMMDYSFKGFTDEYIGRETCCHIISDSNRSIAYIAGIMYGYYNCKEDNIVQINSYDALSTSSNSNKYKRSSLVYPEWTTLDEIKMYANRNGSYIHLIGVNLFEPDFVLCYDEPDDYTIKTAYEGEKTLVKIIRKGYPNAIENNGDPYSTLK